MAANLATAPPTNLITERIRTAANRLEQDARQTQSNLNANTVLFKLVAEDMERENNPEAVATLRQGLLEVLDCAHRLEYQCSALQNVSQSFEPRPEKQMTDFAKRLDESTRQFLAADPFDSTTHTFYQQFNQAIWNIHHAGEAAPGQEHEEMVMISSQCGARNQTCPLSGKPITELQDPVRSTECQHIYDKLSVMSYIAQAGRMRRKCAIPGCPKEIRKDSFVCDAALKMLLEELRLRLRDNTVVADYTELEDY